MNREM